MFTETEKYEIMRLISHHPNISANKDFWEGAKKGNAILSKYTSQQILSFIKTPREKEAVTDVNLSTILAHTQLLQFPIILQPSSLPSKDELKLFVIESGNNGRKVKQWVKDPVFYQLDEICNKLKKESNFTEKELFDYIQNINGKPQNSTKKWKSEDDKKLKSLLSHYTWEDMNERACFMEMGN